ncbi:Uncharacterised protein [Salmonella enterica subsp. houtenae]|nr:Uncharacterised protein [Salmonella enterica subsp. houtenae]
MWAESGKMIPAVDQTVTFPQAFSAGCWSVQLTTQATTKDFLAGYFQVSAFDNKTCTVRVAGAEKPWSWRSDG